MNTREPLFQKATIVSAVASVCTLLAAFGVQVRPELRDAIVQVGALAAIAAPFVTAWAARGHVTPVADPRGADGTPLVPATPSVDQADPAV